MWGIYILSRVLTKFQPENTHTHNRYGWNIDRTPLLTPVTLRTTCRFYDTSSDKHEKSGIITLSIRDEQIFASVNDGDLGRPVVRVRVNRSEGNLYLHFTQKIDDIVLDSVPSPPDTPVDMKSNSSESLLKASTRSMTADLNRIDATLRHTMGDLKNLVSPTKRSDDGPIYQVHPREDEVDSVFAWLHDNAYRVSLSKCRLDFNEADVISFKDKTHGDVTLEVSCGNLDNRQQYIMVSFDDGVAKPLRFLRHDGDRRIYVDAYGFGNDEKLTVPFKDKYRVLEYVLNCWSRFQTLTSSASYRGTEVVISTPVDQSEKLTKELELLRVRHERWTRVSKLGDLEDDWFGNPLDRALHVRHAFLESMGSLLSPFFHTPAEFPDTFTLVPRGDPSAIRLNGIYSNTKKLRLRLDESHPGLGIGFSTTGEENHLSVVPSSDSIQVKIEVFGDAEDKSRRRVLLRLDSKSYVAVMSSRRSHQKDEDFELHRVCRKDSPKAVFVVVEDNMLRPDFVKNDDLVLGLRSTFEDRVKHFCVSDLNEMTTVVRDCRKLKKTKFLEQSCCIKGLGNLFERECVVFERSNHFTFS